MHLRQFRTLYFFYYMWNYTAHFNKQGSTENSWAITVSKTLITKCTWRNAVEQSFFYLFKCSCFRSILLYLKRKLCACTGISYVVFFYYRKSSKRYKLLYTSIDDSDQPAHPRSLIRVLDGRPMGSKESNVCKESNVSSGGKKLRFLSDSLCGYAEWF